MMSTNASTYGIPSISASATEVIGVSTLNQLSHQFGLLNPMAVDSLSLSGLKKADEDEKRVYNLREEIQRAFNKTRRDNVESYKTYINELHNGNIRGAVPNITLYTNASASYDKESGELRIPYGAPLIAIDGETQTAARFRLMSENSDTGSIPVKFNIHYNIDIDAAKKIVHDLNHEGAKIKESEIASLNVDGAATQLITRGINAGDVPFEQINRRGDGMGSKTRPFKTTFKRLQSFATGVHYNDVDPKATPETFLKLHNGLDHQSINDEVLIEKGIARLVNFPRETAVKVNPTVARALGILVSRHKTVEMLTVATVDTLTSRLNGLKGQRGIVRQIEIAKNL